MKHLYSISAVAALVAVVIGVPSLAERIAATDSSASAPLKVSSAKAPAQNSTEDDAVRASEVLDALRADYRDLDGVTVVMGETPKGEEAVSYYTVGEIVIDRDHTVSIEKILAHEIWHVIDWRDNGRLDWGENLPPTNASDYAIN